MELTKIIYLARSDGVESTRNGVKNRPSDAKVRREVTTKEKNDEYYVLIPEGDPKYQKALKEIGGLLAKVSYDRGFFRNGLSFRRNITPANNIQLTMMPISAIVWTACLRATPCTLMSPTPGLWK